MLRVNGYVDRIIFRNAENGYTVLSLDCGEKSLSLVGTFNYINEGEYISAEGEMKLHPSYGEQLLVHSYQIERPEDAKNIEKYLGSGAFKGVGAALAKRIVEKFKGDTLRILEREPERLSEVKGISEKMAMAIGEQVEEKKDMSEAMLFLQKYGVSMKLSAKIYKEYGSSLYGVITENPYKLADDISGVGFKIADDIAAKVGIQKDAAFRIKSGLVYILNTAALSGHVYLPMEEALKHTAELLGLDMADISEHILDMQMEKRIVVKKMSDFNAVYSAHYYYMELNCAKMLHDIDIRSHEDMDKVCEALAEVEKSAGICLDELQRKAVIEAVYSGLLIITGGPGTGKTTVINSIIRYFEDKHMEVALAAPTGRAAKRMTEATGHEARTIHRLLEINGMPEEEGSAEERYALLFERNESNPLEADVVIIDEVSMVDIGLFHALLKAVSVGTRLILVGDTNQLPSVGPGNVLKDMIASDCFNVVVLHQIYRQALGSDIIVNAHKMIDEEPIDLHKKSEDFVFIAREEPERVISVILTLLKEKLPPYLRCKSNDIQVMSPMRKGVLGVERLNLILQEHLNPPLRGKEEKSFGDLTLRVGDKVMQVKNNYQLEWKVRDDRGNIRESGMGVYNGDVGIVRSIDLYEESIAVEYDDKRVAEYDFSMVGELELAYAITVHKSQGSEYPAVIIPLFRGPRLLMSRNLIYTAVTRAKSMVVLVGSGESFYEMVGNTLEMKRFSGLDERIQELAL